MFCIFLQIPPLTRKGTIVVCEGDVFLSHKLQNLIFKAPIEAIVGTDMERIDIASDPSFVNFNTFIS